jgi:hypothetical protein
VIPSKTRIADIGNVVREEDGRVRIDVGRMDEGVFYRFSLEGETFLARRYGRKVVVYEAFDGETLVAIPLYELEVNP